MAVKISELPTASLVTSDDVFPIVDGSTIITQRASAQQILNYITGSTFNTLTASYGLVSGDLRVIGTASIGQLNTVSQTSLLIGDKYITILSGGVDHTGLNGAGYLWGTSSGPGETTGALGEHAHILYDASRDALEIFPGLYVTGSTSLFDISGTTAQFTTISGSTVTGSTAQFTTITSSDLVLSGGYVLMHEPLDLGERIGDNAYILYNSGIDKLAAFPGLYVTGAITASTAISASNIGATTAVFSVVSASIVSASSYVGPIGGTPGGTNQTIQFNSGSTFSGSTNFVYDYVSGNIGIGTTNPSVKLDMTGVPYVDGDNRVVLQVADITPMAAGVGAGFTFGGVYTGSAGLAGFAGIKGIKENGTDGNLDAALVFMTRKNGVGSIAEKMRITSNGNVGIATNNPASRLHVKEAGSSTGVWKGRIVAGGDSVAFLMGEYNSKAWLGAHNAALNAWEDFYLNPDGTNSLFMGSGSASGSLVSVINSTGRVGIGKTSPNSTLDVSGNTIISGNLTVTGIISGSSYQGVGLQSETTRTVNLTSSMTVVQMQTQIDGIGKYISSGAIVTVQFADGTYTINNTLRFQGFFGGGELKIVGNLTETTSSHSNQAVILDSTSVQNLNMVNIENCRLKTTVDRIQFKIVSSSLGPPDPYSCLKIVDSDSINIKYSYFSGSSGASGNYGMQLENVSAKIQENLCTGLEHFINCQQTTKAVSVDNNNTGTQPYVAITALSSIVFKSGTQPIGSLVSFNTGNGGQIY